ncbi:MAG TPA: ribonuclease HII [Pirellula sp.]|nr:ribonuclease HII [Pirellula sp.]
MTNLQWRKEEAPIGMPLHINHSGIFPEVGLDEAGMSCLAGPVYTAAVILPLGFTHNLIRDSKQLSPEQRNEARQIIIENAVAYAVASADVSLIDEINIYHARFRAMHDALSQLETKPKFIIVDGNRFPKYKTIPHACSIKGDTKYLSIAAASILAKTSRDAFMLKLHEQHPQYLWNSNKGYPTKAHRAAIAEHGPCDWHRKSFTLLRETTDDFATDDTRRTIKSFADVG